MTDRRRSLPSTTALQVLIELSKTGYTTAAARALNLSQSAVSKQLLGLENHIGTPLFSRTSGGLLLTKAGHIYLDRAKVALQAMEDANLLIARLEPDQKVLRLQVPPILGDRWLLPLFSGFVELYPDIEVQFTNIISPSEVVTADGVFSFGINPPDNQNSVYLFGKDVVLVATPEYWEKYGWPISFEDLQNGIILEHPNTPIDWMNFVTSRQIKDLPCPRTVRFGYYTMVIRAALAGQGMAFIPRGLILDEISQGKLVHPKGFYYLSKHVYWFTPLLGSEQNEPIMLFNDWLKTVI